MKIVIRDHGYGTKGGLMTGLTATLGRHGVWNMIYFGMFRSIMPVICPNPKEISKMELNSKRFFLGCLCGTLGNKMILTTIFYVEKSQKNLLLKLF